jgi:chemotaxis protein methyltransferase CheR
LVTLAAQASTLMVSGRAARQSVDEAGYTRLTNDVRLLLGLDLSKYKPVQVWRRVLAFTSARGYADPASLVVACRLDPDLRAAFRDMITINVSEFFRNPAAWGTLGSRFLPRLLAGRTSIRIWSAGCSYGYEPYSLAMLVREAAIGVTLRIVATDVDDAILARARAGRFDEIQMAGVSPNRRARFFQPIDDDWEIRPELRPFVTWRRQDLLLDPFVPGVDLIVCRNVVIYFTDAAKIDLYRRFAESLTADGILFIGATESISAANDAGLVAVAPGFYRRKP